MSDSEEGEDWGGKGSGREGGRDTEGEVGVVVGRGVKGEACGQAGGTAGPEEEADGKWTGHVNSNADRALRLAVHDTS